VFRIKFAKSDVIAGIAIEANIVDQLGTLRWDNTAIGEGLVNNGTRLYYVENAGPAIHRIDPVQSGG
jgi:hypothetical protein